jgi:hypothetical protein
MTLPAAWQTQLDAFTARVDDAEVVVFDTTLAAMSEYLRLVRAAVLGGRTITAAADDEVPPEQLPPNLDAFPPPEVWAQLLADGLLATLEAVWGEAFAAIARIAPIAVTPYRATFVTEVTDRLSRNLWPDGVFEECRYELQEGIDAGESINQLRDRLGLVLGIDAPSRAVRAQINEHKRRGEPVPGELYAQLREADRTWHYFARRIARTETLMASNGGTHAAAVASVDLLGEQRWKVWYATSDNRVRDAHWLAHGQVRDVREKFDVMGEGLDHPGDPLGSAANVIQCRCTELILTTQDEADEQAARYDAELPHRTDPEGEPLVPTPKATGRRSTTAAAVDDVDPAEQTTQTTQTPLYWEGPLMALDHATGDGRLMETPKDGIVATNHPWLSWQRASAYGHDGKVGVGRPERLWIAPAALDGQQVPHLWGGGTFDPTDADADTFVAKLAAGYAGTVSVDLDQAVGETRWFDPEGNQVDEPTEDEWWDWAEGQDIGKEPLAVFPQWRFAGVTGVQDPAFHTGWIQLVSTPSSTADVWTLDMTSFTGAQAITASAGSLTWCEQVAARAPEQPPAAWFQDPRLTGWSKLRVTDEGRVYGHIAPWGAEHASIPGMYVPADPHGGSYPRWHHHPVHCSDGSVVLTGPISTGGHADTDEWTTLTQAQAHYDRPEFVGADVVVGEDAHGIWCSGSLRPGVTPLQVLFLSRYSQSGDWRNGELIASCAVSVPAFDAPHDPSVVALAASAGPHRPVLASARTRCRIDEHGRVAALVAAGVPRGRARRTDRAAAALPATAGFDLMRQLRQAQRTDHQVAAAARRIVGAGVEAARHRVIGN